MYGRPQQTSRSGGQGSSDYSSYSAPSSKEQEVDALTQMLMQGLEGSKDPDFYGTVKPPCLLLCLNTIIPHIRNHL